MRADLGLTDRWREWDAEQWEGFCELLRSMVNARFIECRWQQVRQDTDWIMQFTPNMLNTSRPDYLVLERNERGEAARDAGR